MAEPSNNPTRRDFLRSACAAGTAALVGAGAAPLGAQDKAPELIPTRVLGKTGLKIPILGLGGEFDIVRNQLMLKQAHKLGLRFWDTAPEYEDSESGYGAFLAKNPALRKDLVLSTKTEETSPRKMTAQLDASLAALKTDYVDLYFIHHLDSPDVLDEWGDEWKAWADKAKKAGKIKFFGASFHDNVMENLIAVSRTGWMDMAMFLCNYRVLPLPKLKKAMEAAQKANLGQIAIKVQALRLRAIKLSPQDIESVKQLTDKGFSEPQARLKLVWDSPQVHSACTLMKNLTQLNAGAAAAVDKTAISAADKALWQQYAQATCGGYCTGCARICGEAVGRRVPVRDILRLLTYHNEYGDRARARRQFAALGDDVPGRLGRTDYSRAERDCPQRIPIGRLMDEAARVLA